VDAGVPIGSNGVHYRDRLVFAGHDQLRDLPARVLTRAVAPGDGEWHDPFACCLSTVAV